MINTILHNLLGYDLIIILLALMNGFYIMPKAIYYSHALKERLQSKIYLPIVVLLKNFDRNAQSAVDIHQLKAFQEKESRFYSIFSTLNGIFPMLGMLGTILSLLGMISLESESVLLNFTTALTSTFWGLVCAILFKAFDGYISNLVEQNSENFTLLLDRIDRYNIEEATDEERKAY